LICDNDQSKNEIKREAASQGLLLLFAGFFTFASALKRPRLTKAL
jgi:hypothetical protein